MLTFACALLLLSAPAPPQAGLAALPPLAPERIHALPADWLIEQPTVRAGAFRGQDPRTVVLDNGLLRRTFLVGESATTIGLDDLSSGEALIRAVAPEARLEVNGEPIEVGGIDGQPDPAFLDPTWLATVSADGGTLRLTGITTGPIEPRLEWKRLRHHAEEAAWPPPGVELRFDYAPRDAARGGLEVSVHYALYDGLPAYSKWLTVRNGTKAPITVDRFQSEILRATEHSSWVETRSVAQPTPDLHVETDYSFGGMTYRNANAHAVRWQLDPEFSTQVNYERTTPCLLEVGPELGPAAVVAPDETFTTFRTFVMSPGRGDRERQGLSRRRLVRTIAPWVTENPLMMHVRWSDRETVLRAIEQCAAVGFEMVILTFGSGFNIENTDPAYLAQMKEYADRARSVGIEIGGYSLLSSRRVQPEGDNCIHPGTGKPGADIHGNCPSLTSGWGQRYFETLRAFYDTTGFALLEHDGSYPGTPDDSVRLPLQSGLENSRWAQWSVIDSFYRWCRGRGVYLNVPDHYYLAGSNKCGMGYREVNWSLPRAQQVLHTRQNIYDGTWTKTPSMGWMFVPLTEYHGGGEAATIEPLSEHLDHYERMLRSNLALGVQACYRGPRLYDTDATRAMVARNVAWFKEHRRVLESDLVHGRRADGRDLDWMLHVDPFAPEGEPRGMLVIFNPTDVDIERPIRVDAYYTGLDGRALVSGDAGDAEALPLDRSHLTLDVRVPAGGMVWRALAPIPN